MKNKSWIIILIMGIALTISVAYSIVVSRQHQASKNTVTTTSIVEMRAAPITIKNTLTGIGNVEYKAKEVSAIDGNIIQNGLDENQEEKAYLISLLIEEKDLPKVKEDQKVEILIKDKNLNYKGKVIKINEQANTKSTIDIEITDANESLAQGDTATCTVIVEEAQNVVALPIEAIQKNDNNEEFVDVVQPDGTTKPVIIKTGISDESYVEITSGLISGERVQIVKSSTTVEYENEKTSKK